MWGRATGLHEVITLFTIASNRQYSGRREASLSYQTPQSVRRARNGIQTLPLTMHYGGVKLGENWGRNGWILTQTNSILRFGF